MTRAARTLSALSVLALIHVGACKRGGGAPPTPPLEDAAAAAVVTSADAAEAGPAPSAADAATPDAHDTQGYGAPRDVRRGACAGVTADGRRHRVALADMKVAFPDGDDLLALVNRSAQGALGADYAPSDLVDLRTGKPLSSAECERYPCLRKEAAEALTALLAEMKRRGFPGKVESAYRSFGAQCGTFLNWAKKSDFCEATEQSALPGHSQHQLGTTVDLFTEEWAKDPRGVFREGFGCTPAGKFLRESAWELGFVMPYPIHPDDRHPKQRCVVRWDIPVNINPRTGYRFEHWHLRYIGKAAARELEEARAKGAGTPDEITLEQFLRARRGLTLGDADLPVCDGCNCGACTTLAPPGVGPCAEGGAIHLDARGAPIFGKDAPEITDARFGRIKKWAGPALEVKLEVPAGVITQTPVTGAELAAYAEGATFERLAPYPDTAPRAYAPIAGAWVVAVEPVGEGAPSWRWRAAILDRALAVGRIYNRANVLLPAGEGRVTVRVPLPKGVTSVKVALLRDGDARGTRTVGP